MFNAFECDVRDLPSIGMKVEHPVLFVAREKGEHRNAFHATTDFMNAFIMLELFDLLPLEVQVLILDNHPPSALDDFWNRVISKKEPFAKSIDYSNQVVLFSRVIFSPPGYSNVFYPGLNSLQHCLERVPLFSGFSHFVKESFNVSVPPVSDSLKVLVIDRKPRLPLYPKMSRQFSDTDSVKRTLLLAGESLSVPVHVSVEDFATRSLEEQIQISASHDIMVGIHGAALTHAFWLPQSGGLIELRPNSNQDWFCFAHLAHYRGLQYDIWFNSDSGRIHLDDSGELIDVDLNFLAQASRKMYSQVIERKSSGL
jgi:hypothetical protein